MYQEVPLKIQIFNAISLVYLRSTTYVLVIVMSTHMARLAPNKSSKRRQQETSASRATRRNGPVNTPASSVPRSSRETPQSRVRSPSPSRSDTFQARSIIT